MQNAGLRAYCRSLVHLYAPNGEKYKPTITPTPGFSPTADAEHLKRAMRGLGTNERAIIDILGNRTSAERMAIRDAYPSISSKTLHDALTSELSGKFRRFALLLIQSPWQVMAEALYDAMKGAGTKERVLNEIIAGCSKDDIPQLKKAFEEVSGGETLDDAIKGDTSGDYREALLLALAGQADEPQAMQLKNLTPSTLSQVVNPGLAETDAKELYACGEGRPGTAESRFMRPIVNRSFLQLNATNEAYNRAYGHPLIDAIKKETSRDLEDFLITRVRYATDRASLFAELLHFAMRGAGTKDSTLQRVLALRADTDLGSIKEKYAELYGETLEAAIKGDTSGDYEALCLKLIGPA
ncbi:Annexin A8 [Taenia solium]|eukprot:TsM_000024300 transcript=TsM_000024300 gene=TsM_000024300